MNDDIHVKLIEYMETLHLITYYYRIIHNPLQPLLNQGRTSKHHLVVAWGEELDKMITILDRLGVRANFFIEGRYAENHKNKC